MITNDKKLRHLQDALDLSSNFWKVTKKQIMGSKRNLKIMNARHSVRYYLTEVGDITLSEIGMLTNCDHATVINSKKKFKDYSQVDREFLNMKAIIQSSLEFDKNKSLQDTIADIINSNLVIEEKVTIIMSIYESR